MEKGRFKQLLESKMGNVKPLINEGLESELSSIITSKKTQGCDEIKRAITDVLKSNQTTSESQTCKNSESFISDVVDIMDDLGLLDKETIRCFREGVLEYCKTAPKVFSEPTIEKQIEKQIDWKEIDELTALKYSKDPNYETREEPFMIGNVKKYKYFYKSKF